MAEEGAWEGRFPESGEVRTEDSAGTGAQKTSPGGEARPQAGPQGTGSTQDFDEKPPASEPEPCLEKDPSPVSGWAVLWGVCPTEQCGEGAQALL